MKLEAVSLILVPNKQSPKLYYCHNTDTITKTKTKKTKNKNKNKNKKKKKSLYHAKFQRSYNLLNLNTTILATQTCKGTNKYLTKGLPKSCREA